MPRVRSLATLLGPAQVVDLKAKTAVAAVTELVKALPGPGPALRKTMTKAVLARETSMSTAVGSGIAVPHARLEKLSRIYLVLGRSKVGLDFKAPDGQKVRIVVLIVTPASRVNAYLQLLASVLWTFSDDAVRRQALEAPSGREALAALARFRP